MTVIKEPGSYRDPTGSVFYHKGNVYRWVAESEKSFYIDLLKKDFFKTLVKDGYHVQTALAEFADKDTASLFGTSGCYFRHETIDLVSYPYEWSRGMIYQAAIHTLELQERLLNRNYSLKDATPYNIQFKNGKSIFIDFCSISPASQNGIWIAYNQLCQMFLYPMLFDRFEISRLKNTYLSNLEGLSLKDTVSSIGFKPFWRFGLMLDYFFPALISKIGRFKKLDVGGYTVPTSRKLKNSCQIQLHMVNRLQKAITKLVKKSSNSFWINYDQVCSYSEADEKIKADFIKTAIAKHRFRTVLDIGCNTGKFSILASSMECKVTAIDTDHDCVDALYHLSKENNYNILPLCVDITNPSPSLGWFNEERQSLLHRIEKRHDCVFALALIHHLLITHRLPFEELPRLLAHCTKQYVIVEYVDISDQMVQVLLKYRTEAYDHWNINLFEKVMTSSFRIVDKQEINNKALSLHRCLYFLELNEC